MDILMNVFEILLERLSMELREVGFMFSGKEYR